MTPTELHKAAGDVLVSLLSRAAPTEDRDTFQDGFRSGAEAFYAAFVDQYVHGRASEPPEGR